MSENFSGGNVPNRRNTTRQIEVKILNAINTASSASGSGGLAGTGSPQGIVTALAGTTYFQTDTSSFWVKSSGTGNSGWTELIA